MCMRSFHIKRIIILQPSCFSLIKVIVTKSRLEGEQSDSLLVVATRNMPNRVLAWCRDDVDKESKGSTYKTLFESTASASDSASGSILSSEAPNLYAKNAQFRPRKNTLGQVSLSRIWSRGFEKAYGLFLNCWLRLRLAYQNPTVIHPSAANSETAKDARKKLTVSRCVLWCFARSDELLNALVQPGWVQM